MIQKIALIVAIFVISALLYLRGLAVQHLAVAPRPTPTPTAIKEKAWEPLDDGVLWELIQDWRVENGYKAYTRDSRLCVIAEKRVEEIQKDYSHDKFVKDYANYPIAIQENILSFALDEDEALNAWLDSPAHRETLEKPYRSSCVATGGPYGQYAVQVFGSF